MKIAVALSVAHSDLDMQVMVHIALNFYVYVVCCSPLTLRLNEIL
jgi:hypothetical protein